MEYYYNQNKKQDEYSLVNSLGEPNVLPWYHDSFKRVIFGHSFTSLAFMIFVYGVLRQYI